MLQKTGSFHQRTSGEHGTSYLPNFSSRLKAPRRQGLRLDGFQAFSIWPDSEYAAAAQYTLGELLVFEKCQAQLGVILRTPLDQNPSLDFLDMWYDYSGTFAWEFG